MTEQLHNLGETTLAAGITAIATTLTVVDGSVLSSSGTFRLNIDDEILVCSGRVGNVCTVSERGAEGTSPEAHGAGVDVCEVLSAAGLINSINERISTALTGYAPTPHDNGDHSETYITSAALTGYAPTPHDNGDHSETYLTSVALTGASHNTLGGRSAASAHPATAVDGLDEAMLAAGFIKTISQAVIDDIVDAAVAEFPSLADVAHWEGDWMPSTSYTRGSMVKASVMTGVPPVLWPLCFIATADIPYVAPTEVTPPASPWTEISSAPDVEDSTNYAKLDEPNIFETTQTVYNDENTGTVDDPEAGDERVIISGTGALMCQKYSRKRNGALAWRTVGGIDGSGTYYETKSGSDMRYVPLPEPTYVEFFPATAIGTDDDSYGFQSNALLTSTHAYGCVYLADTSDWLAGDYVNVTVPARDIGGVSYPQTTFGGVVTNVFGSYITFWPDIDVDDAYWDAIYSSLTGGNKWLAGTTYALGSRVKHGDPRRYYRSPHSGNQGHDPDTSPADWVEILGKPSACTVQGLHSSLLDTMVPVVYHTEEGDWVARYLTMADISGLTHTDLDGLHTFGDHAAEDSTFDATVTNELFSWEEVANFYDLQPAATTSAADVFALRYDYDPLPLGVYLAHDDGGGEEAPHLNDWMEFTFTLGVGEDIPVSQRLRLSMYFGPAEGKYDVILDAGTGDEQTVGTDLDAYSSAGYRWWLKLDVLSAPLAEGDHTIRLVSKGKNPASADTWIEGFGLYKAIGATNTQDAIDSASERLPTADQKDALDGNADLDAGNPVAGMDDIPPPTHALLVMDGDSLTTGAYVTRAPDSYPGQLAGLRPRGLAMRCAGRPSQRWADMKAAALDVIGEASLPGDYSNFWSNTGFIPYTDKIVVAWGGANDIGTSRSAADTWADIQTYCGWARANFGYKIVLGTVLPSGTFTAPQETQRLALNVLIRTGWAAIADGLADFDAATELQDPTNTTYFNADQTHLKAAGYAVVAGIVDDALTTLGIPTDGAPTHEVMSRGRTVSRIGETPSGLNLPAGLWSQFSSNDHIHHGDLDDLDDVDASSPSDLDLIRWSAGDAAWKSAALTGYSKDAGLGGHSMSDHNDGPYGAVSSVNTQTGDVVLDAGDVGAAPTPHGNGDHSSTFITSADVTYESLNANSDVGSGSSQVAAGDHSAPAASASVAGHQKQALIPITWTFPGTIAATTGVLRLYLPVDCTYAYLTAGLATAPVGDTLEVDIHYDGTTIWTTQGNRPSFAIGANVPTIGGTPEVTAFVAGHYLTCDVDAFTGSAAANLTVTLWCKVT